MPSRTPPKSPIKLEGPRYTDARLRGAATPSDKPELAMEIAAELLREGDPTDLAETLPKQ